MRSGLLSGCEMMLASFHLVSGAFSLESALLDVSPEDALELNKKRRVLRWDAKKRKFVKVRQQPLPYSTRTLTLLCAPVHTTTPAP